MRSLLADGAGFLLLMDGALFDSSAASRYASCLTRIFVRNKETSLSTSAPSTLQSAVIIGAGQGLGAAVARLFAAHGLHVLLIGRTAAKLERVAAEIRAAGGSAESFVADLKDAASLLPLLETLRADKRTFDTMVFSAGEAFIKPFEEITGADWDDVLNANLRTAFVAAQAFLPLVRPSSNPSLFFVTSKVALGGYGGVTAYTAAKTGLLGLARSLAAELREEHIRVVALCPGPMDTPMRHNATPGMDANLLIQPQSVAQTLWLLANLPRGTTTSEILIQSDLYE